MAKAMGRDIKGVPPGRQPLLFVEGLAELQQKCGVDKLKMSDYGISRDDIPKLAQNAFDTIGFLFSLDRYELSLAEAITILEQAYK